MRAGNVWEWLDAVDQEKLDLLDQWGVPSLWHPSRDMPPGSDTLPRDGDGEPGQQHDGTRNTDITRTLESTLPSGILSRSGSIRMTGENSTLFACQVANKGHPKSLVPGFPADVAHDVKSEAPLQLWLPGTTASDGQLQSGQKEGNCESLHAMKIEVQPGPAHAYHASGSLSSTPVIQIEVTDPVAINCQGAKVVGGHQQNGLQTLPSMARKSRRNTTAGISALHRSNALKRTLNVRALPEQHPE